jgi:hypothetical protein
MNHPNGNVLKPMQFDLICRATEHAAPLVSHTDVSLGSALDAACRRHGIVLDDDSYAIAILSLSKYRERLSERRQCSHQTGEQL